MSSIENDETQTLTLTVLLDENRVLDDGSADPDWVADPYVWSYGGIEDRELWLASVMQETRLLAEHAGRVRADLLATVTPADEPGGTELNLTF